MAAGMDAAWQATERTPIDDLPIQWDTRDVRLPPAAHLEEHALIAMMDNKDDTTLNRVWAARGLAWLRRCQNPEAPPITLSRLRIGKVDLLQLPGELFVEYQLAAQQMRPASFVCTAAYGDYAPGYIGLAMSYDEGGYETSQRASRVAPAVEPVLMKAISELMK